MELSDIHLKKLKEQYEDLRGKTLDKTQLDTVSEMLSKLTTENLQKMCDMDIAILSDIAKDKIKPVEEKVDNAYAIGMAQAMKSTGDQPPLKKSTITKAHDIAKAINKDENAPAVADIDRLKKMGMKPKKEDLGKEDEPKVKQIIKKLKGASQAHAGQAKDLEKALKSEEKDQKEVDEASAGFKLVQKAKAIAKKMAGDYSGAVKEIEKLKKDLSKVYEVELALKAANESLEEATAHVVRYTDPLNKKRFAIPYKTHADAEKKMAQLKKDGVKQIGITMDTLKPGVKFKESYLEESLNEFTLSQLNTLKKSYAGMKGKTISPEKATALSKHLDKLDLLSLRQLNKEKIPFISTLARNKIYRKTGKFEELEELNDFGLKGRITDAQLKNIKDVWAKKTKMDITPGVKSMIARMDIPTKLAIQHANINILSDLVKESKEHSEMMYAKVNNYMKKIKNEKKSSSVKDIFSADKEGQSMAQISKRFGLSLKTVKDILGEADNYPTSDINKKKVMIATDPKRGEKKPINLGARMKYESIQAVKNKAKKTGMPYSILKKVYDRGMAAWKGGHRPGATQVQWALARVNSFVTKSSGTWGGADKDLAKQVRGSK